MATGQNAPSTAWGACTKIVEAATKSCAAEPAQMPQGATGPNWDAMANSFASLSTAIAWGSLVLALVAIVAGITWGKLVANAAEREAKVEAKRCAEAYIREWLAKEAPGIVQNHVGFILDAELGPGDDRQAADDIGVGA